ncbi:hypothetical protein PGQ11_003078 [Apiospora arundinis]|uniref:NACHT domain-containing protein n=1 Tax=Apiospora arundinis TaxID=335852 RepID=A0ABR2J4I5_9PEZI
MPTPAPSDQARKAMKSAFNQLQATITPGHARSFSSTTLEHVRTELLKIENELAARQLLRNTRRLAPLLQGLEHYAKVMDVLCNGTPFLPWVWAPITLILRIASEHLEAFEHIVKGYRRIAECLGRFAVLDNAFKHVHGFQQTLAVFYADILEFHGHAYQFVHRSGWKLLFVTSWHRFQRRFDHIFDNLKKHEELIDKEANAHNIAEAQQMRLDVRAWQEKCAEQLERTDRDQSIKQHDSIISWLKVDGSDQLNIFQALFEESTKYPGTCEWVIQHKTVRSFLQRKPEVPVLWIQGAAGTGKSVLSSNIMNYMDHSGWLVLSHFCNYAYPSSTKYDCILRSLLAQLIRKDGDLAAHVYEDYVLGKKTPSIPILERLLHFLLSSISKQSQQTAYIWVILDGLDECDSVTQNKVLSLITHATSRAPSSSEVICKALISCRFSASASTKLRRTQAISLAEEKEQMSKSIQLYAAQRLNAIYSKFQQLSLSEDDIKGIEDTITKKADGMFLYARLVLDYLSSNIFFHGYEIKDSVHELPKELSEFYSKIVTQILVHLNRRSVDRLKCALGWIAFSRRPLKKMEFLSANAFSSDEEEVKHVAPQYMLDICTALIEERPDSRLGFIHVSVKEFLQSKSSNLVLIERDCLLQHGIATVRCLLAGIEAFLKAVPQHHEQVLLEVIKGLHSFHIYSKEYWTDYLLSLVKPDEEEDSTYNPLFNRALEFATKLDQHGNGGSEPTTYVDERISNLPDPLLRRVLNECLKARSEGDLKLKLQQVEAKGKAVANTGILAIPSPSEGVSLLLERYQATLQYLLRQTDFPGITAAEFNSFKRQSRSSAFTCRVKGCPQATEGLESQAKCHEHELLHVRRPECTYPGCQYPPFVSSAALKRHINTSHNPTPQRKAIRRVKNMHPGSLQYANIPRPKAADERDSPSYQEPKESIPRYTSYPSLPKLDRTMTDIYNDKLESPSITIESASPAAQSQLVMSPSSTANKHESHALSYDRLAATLQQREPQDEVQQLNASQIQDIFTSQGVPKSDPEFMRLGQILENTTQLQQQALARQQQQLAQEQAQQQAQAREVPPTKQPNTRQQAQIGGQQLVYSRPLVRTEAQRQAQEVPQIEQPSAPKMRHREYQTQQKQQQHEQQHPDSNYGSQRYGDTLDYNRRLPDLKQFDRAISPYSLYPTYQRQPETPIAAAENERTAITSGQRTADSERRLYPESWSRGNKRPSTVFDGSRTDYADTTIDPNPLVFDGRNTIRFPIYNTGRDMTPGGGAPPLKYADDWMTPGRRYPLPPSTFSSSLSSNPMRIPNNRPRTESVFAAPPLPPPRYVPVDDPLDNVRQSALDNFEGPLPLLVALKIRIVLTTRVRIRRVPVRVIMAPSVLLRVVIARSGAPAQSLILPFLFLFILPIIGKRHLDPVLLLGPEVLLVGGAHVLVGRVERLFLRVVRVRGRQTPLGVGADGVELLPRVPAVVHDLPVAPAEAAGVGGDRLARLEVCGVAGREGDIGGISLAICGAAAAAAALVFLHTGR